MRSVKDLSFWLWPPGAGRCAFAVLFVVFMLLWCYSWMESPVLVDVASVSIIVFSSVFSPAPGLRAPRNCEGGALGL